jgi:hypothetical protein
MLWTAEVMETVALQPVAAAYTITARLRGYKVFPPMLTIQISFHAVLSKLNYA